MTSIPSHSPAAVMSDKEEIDKKLKDLEEASPKLYDSLHRVETLLRANEKIIADVEFNLKAAGADDQQKDKNDSSSDDKAEAEMVSQIASLNKNLNTILNTYNELNSAQIVKKP